MKTERPIDFFAFHDGVVEQMSVAADGSVVIVFEHLFVYFELRPGVAETWSARATLRLGGVSRLELQGTFEAGEYVMFDTLWDANGEKFHDLTLDTIKSARRIQFDFFSAGAVLDLSMAEASLVVEDLVARHRDLVDD